MLHPLRRRDDGSYEQIDWDSAVREVGDRLGAVRDAFGGDKIMYYGRRRPGQPPLRRVWRSRHKGFGGKYRSSAVGQEKSGEIWVAAASSVAVFEDLIMIAVRDKRAARRGEASSR